MMAVQDEAPEAFEVLERLAKHTIMLNSEFSDIELLASAHENGLDEAVSVFEALREEARSAIAAHVISDEAMARFVAAVDADLNDPTLTKAKIDITLAAMMIPARLPEDWFWRLAGGEGGLLDVYLSFIVLHPALLDEAKRRWGANQRVEFQTYPLDGSHVETQKALLAEHGISSDYDWFWAVEALDIASKALKLMGVNFRLCDFVKWTCTGEPPNILLGETFGEPELFLEARFGERLGDERGAKELDGGRNWKLSEGVFVSPLWEYLGRRNYGEFGEHSWNLSRIGEGLDAAVTALDRHPDLSDGEYSRLFLSSIFQAGEALTKLRVKMELQEDALRGLLANANAAKRAEKGGARSAAARSTRRAALMSSIEEVINRNPDAARFGERAVLGLAVDEAAAKQPDLWAQGKGQAEEYIGEIRRGEAGHELQARYAKAFPAKPHKRFRS